MPPSSSDSSPEFVGTAACVAGNDPVKMLRLPFTDGMVNRVIIPSRQRFAYDQAVRMIGCHIVEIDTREELDRIRATGLAVNDEELAYGLRSIAAPVYSHSGEVLAALNLAIHRTMVSMDELIERYGPAVKQSASDISLSMGHRLTPA